MIVADLIDPLTMEWNVNVIHKHFQPIDSEVILDIPLSILGLDVQIVWHYAKDGQFSIRNAYHLACTLESDVARVHRIKLKAGGVPFAQNCDIGLSAAAPSPSRWSLPPVDSVKLNCDGTVFSDGQELGVGIVARDDRGICLALAAVRLPRSDT
ncbi:hypothetical protein Salat_2147500 [Sesamum alatum]|uniref:RNase H type-1 domain-containing protein n=1 Tax=Sesamum alatum TaxID=300844 RepID=A0AAE2CH42_9LAMI|nr:hypothetical protein Salat_2147500 [Sesamum alatum]